MKISLCFSILLAISCAKTATSPTPKAERVLNVAYRYKIETIDAKAFRIKFRGANEGMFVLVHWLAQNIGYHPVGKWIRLQIPKKGEEPNIKVQWFQDMDNLLHTERWNLDIPKVR